MTQNKQLLQRLRQANGGYVFNYEIVHNLNILKYTNRISELRAKGYDIEVKRFPERGQGVFGYRLVDADIIGIGVAKLLQMKF